MNSKLWHRAKNNDFKFITEDPELTKFWIMRLMKQLEDATSSKPDQAPVAWLFTSWGEYQVSTNEKWSKIRSDDGTPIIPLYPPRGTKL